MSKYKIAGIIYIHIGMNGWVKFYAWNISTQDIACSQRQTHTSILTQFYIMSIQPANKAVKHLINWYVHVYNTGKQKWDIDIQK